MLQAIHRKLCVFVGIFILRCQIAHGAVGPPLIASKDLAVTDITSSSARVTWTKTNAAQYGYRFNFVVTIAPDAGVTIYPNPVAMGTSSPETKLTGLASVVRYEVTLRTHNKGIYGNRQMIAFTTKPNAVNPYSIVISSITTNSARVSWVKVVGVVTNYIVSISGGPATGAKASPGTVTTLNAPATDLIQLGSGYKYTVSITTVYNGISSVTVNRQFFTKPTPPVASKVSISAVTTTTAKISWERVYNGQYSGYTTHITPSGTITPPYLSANEMAPSVAISALQPATEYTFYLLTVVGSTMSERVTKTFKTKTQMVDPSSVSYAAPITWPTIINLSWAEASGTFKSYEISVKPSKGGARADPSSVQKGTTSTVLRDLTPGTEYTVTIRTNTEVLGMGATVKFWAVFPPESPDETTYSVSAASGVIGEEPDEVIEGSFVIDF